MISQPHSPHIWECIQVVLYCFQPRRLHAQGSSSNKAVFVNLSASICNHIGGASHSSSIHGECDMRHLTLNSRNCSTVKYFPKSSSFTQQPYNACLVKIKFNGLVVIRGCCQAFPPIPWQPERPKWPLSSSIKSRCCAF